MVFRCVLCFYYGSLEQVGHDLSTRTRQSSLLLVLFYSIYPQSTLKYPIKASNQPRRSHISRASSLHCFAHSMCHPRICRFPQHLWLRSTEILLTRRTGCMTWRRMMRSRMQPPDVPWSSYLDFHVHCRTLHDCLGTLTKSSRSIGKKNLDDLWNMPRYANVFWDIGGNMQRLTVWLSAKLQM